MDIAVSCKRRKFFNKLLFLIFATISVLLVIILTSCVNETSNSSSVKAVALEHDQPPNQARLNVKKQLSAFLVVLVMSGPHSNKQRNTMRETWLKNSEDTVLYRFVIGTAALPTLDFEMLESEMKQYNDLVLLPDLRDSFDVLASKLLKMLVWLDQTVDFQYFLKVDDDTFVRLDAFLKELEKKSRMRLYWGFFDGRAHVHKRGKYKETDWVLCDRYVPFAVGGGYVLSSDLVHFVAQSAPFLKKYHAEDVSLGSWLAATDVRREHDPRFDTEYKSRGCHNSYLVTHKQSMQDMREKYQRLRNTGLMCAREQQLRLSYIYDWEKPPTECCQRVEGVP